MNPRHQVLYAGIGIVACLLLFDTTALDFRIQSLLFDATTQQWLWPRHEPWLRFFLYDGIKAALIALALGLIATLVFARRVDFIRRHRADLLLVVLSLMIGPALVSLLKASTDVTCPKNLLLYGGDLVYHSPLAQLFQHTDYPDSQSCFPAGHASGGFALMAFYYLFDTPRAKRWALATAILVGWTMGLYKMAIGDHFFSHTLVAMLLDWLCINSLWLLVHARRRAPVTTPHRRPARSRAPVFPGGDKAVAPAPSTASSHP